MIGLVSTMIINQIFIVKKEIWIDIPKYKMILRHSEERCKKLNKL